MRTIKFDKESIEYSLLHRASIQSEFKPSPRQYQMIAEIQTRLESVGKPLIPDGEKPDSSAVYLHYNPKACQAVFEEEEFALLKSLFEHTSFANSIARFVAKTQKLLDSVQEEKPMSKLKRV